MEPKEVFPLYTPWKTTRIQWESPFKVEAIALAILARCFRNPKANHRLDVKQKPVGNHGDELPTSTGEFTGFLKHQQYEQQIVWEFLKSKKKTYPQFNGTHHFGSRSLPGTANAIISRQRQAKTQPVRKLERNFPGLLVVVVVVVAQER